MALQSAVHVELSRPILGLERCADDRNIEKRVHGVLLKWVMAFSVATTSKNQVSDRKSAVFLVSVPYRVVVSSVGKKSFPSGNGRCFDKFTYTSPSHRMHVTN